MSQSTRQSEIPAAPLEAADPLSAHAILQFLHVVRYRRHVMFAALAVSLALGGLYYATATRYYDAQASLLILQMDNEVTSTSMGNERNSQGLMPTYQRLLASAVVLDGALRRIRPEHRVDLVDVPQQLWIETLRKNLKIAVASKTNILEITYRSRSSTAAVAVVNAVLSSYLEFMERTHKGNAAEIIDVLTREKDQLDGKLARKESEILKIREQFGDLGIRAGDKVLHPVVQRAIDLNTAAVEAQKKRYDLQGTAASVETALRNGEDLQHYMLAIEVTVGKEFLLSALGFNARDAQTLAAMEKSLLEDRAEQKTFMEFYGPAHPRVLEVRNRIKDTQEYLATYQDRVDQKMAQLRRTQLGPLLVNVLQQRLRDAWQHEQGLHKAFENARTEAVSLNCNLARLEIAEHDLKWLRSLHDVLLNQISNLDLKRDRGDIRTSVVSEPIAKDKHVSPRLIVVAIICLVGGLGLGLAAVYVLDALDDRFQTPEELRSALGTSVLAMIGSLESLPESGIESLQLHAAPSSGASEAFRTLRTALAFSGGDTQRLVVSSSEPGDGKTTIIANLAVAYAQAGKKTLLIDADMRRPGMTALLQMRGMTGLSEVLRQTDTMPQCAQVHIRPSGIAGLDVLPSGPRPVNPGELLSGLRLPELLAWAETVYDQILIDTPPALAATDAAVIGRLVDGVVLVVQPGKNQRRLVIRAAESFTGLGAALFGIVVNRITAEKDLGYYGYGYGYDYSAYGHEADDTRSTGKPSHKAAVSADDASGPIAQCPSTERQAYKVPQRRAA